MRKMILIAVLIAGILSGLQQTGSSIRQEKTGAAATTVPEGVIKVTITMGGGLYGPVKDQFKVGEEIPVAISNRNSNLRQRAYSYSAQNQAASCVSSLLCRNFGLR